MGEKKWPMLGQVLIALGCVSGLQSILNGLIRMALWDLVCGIILLAVYWNVYKFKPWALKALTIVLSLNIVIVLLNALTGVPLVLVIIVLGLNIWILIYFNSAKTKALFV